MYEECKYQEIGEEVWVEAIFSRLASWAQLTAV